MIKTQNFTKLENKIFSLKHIKTIINQIKIYHIDRFDKKFGVKFELMKVF